MNVGKAPACIECAHLELQPCKVAGEHVRRVDGQLVIFLCTRAADPLTGNSPELCHTERQVGLCGPRGLYFEQSDAKPVFAFSEAPDEDVPLSGEDLAEEIEEEILD